MSLSNLSIKEFLSVVDADSPTPGGGSVSALAIAQGISLINMTYHISIKKKKYLNADNEAKKIYNENYKKLIEFKKTSLDAVDKDTEAFNQVMNAYALPKNNEEEKEIRDNTIYMAMINATIVPQRVAELALEVLKYAKEMFYLTSPSTASDFGVGTLMIYSGLKGAVLNIKTNMTGLNKTGDADQYLNQASIIENESETIFQEIYSEVLKRLK
jgi:formiminotetrahydrofolate cyclodeaminase